MTKETTDKENSLNTPTLCKPFLRLPQNKEHFFYNKIIEIREVKKDTDNFKKVGVNVSKGELRHLNLPNATTLV